MPPERHNARCWRREGAEALWGLGSGWACQAEREGGCSRAQVRGPSSCGAPRCFPVRRPEGTSLLLLGFWAFFFFPFSTSNISHLGSRGVFYTLQRSQLACLIHSFFSLFLTLKALNAVNFASAGSFDCILLLWLPLSQNSLLFILDLLLVLRVIWDVIYGFQFLSGVFYITVSCTAFWSETDF